MSELLILAIIVALIAVVGALAQEFGVDSRVGTADPRIQASDFSR
ncbi:MAG TPA: hypothetical protein VHR16_03205 [Candidatus Limnocylindrales bacterium]|jgi:hypothetical protein|nr:hypothetical protein [Candidatus Limnocylindrales bacterium]